MVLKCDNCGIWFGFAKLYYSLTFNNNIPEHQKFISRRDVEWREENQIFYPYSNNVRGGEEITLSYCLECIKAVREMEIQRTNGIPLTEAPFDMDFFIDRQKEWTERIIAERVAEKDQQITSLKEQVLTLQLQLKEKEVTELHARIEQLCVQPK